MQLINFNGSLQQQFNYIVFTSRGLRQITFIRGNIHANMAFSNFPALMSPALPVPNLINSSSSRNNMFPFHLFVFFSEYGKVLISFQLKF